MMARLRVYRHDVRYTKSAAVLEYSLASVCGKRQQKSNGTLC